MFNQSKDQINFATIEDFCKEWQEGVRVEYKSQYPEDISKTLSSFANTQGGVLVIGVEADKTHNKVKMPIKGIPKTDGIEERIVQSGLMGIYPPVMPEVIIRDVPDTENIIVVVRVDESVQAPHAIQNSTKVYVRVASVSQPYQQPQLAELNHIEYLFNRRQDQEEGIKQIIDQMENRRKQFYSTDETTLTLVARPVFLYRPVISASKIYELYRQDNWIKRVPDGILYILPYGTEIYEINKYGIVSHRTLIHENDQGCIDVINLRIAIYDFMKTAKTLYNNCDYFGNIEVSAQMHNVKDRKLSKKIGNLRQTQLSSELECSVDAFRITAARYYLARDFSKPEHQRSIYEELILQMLWAFDVPSDNEYVIKEVGKLIDPAIK